MMSFVRDVLGLRPHTKAEEDAEKVLRSAYGTEMQNTRVAAKRVRDALERQAPEDIVESIIPRANGKST